MEWLNTAVNWKVVLMIWAAYVVVRVVEMVVSVL